MSEEPEGDVSLKGGRKRCSCCRQPQPQSTGSRRDDKSAPNAVQIRHGQPKALADLRKQTKVNKRNATEIELPLLVVSQQKRHDLEMETKMVAVDASQMLSSHLWHYLVGGRGLPKRDDY